MDQFNEIKKPYTQKNRQGRCLSLKANFEVSFLQNYKKSLYQCSIMAGVLLLTLQSGLVQGADREGPENLQYLEESAFSQNVRIWRETNLHNKRDAKRNKKLESRKWLDLDLCERGSFNKHEQLVIKEVLFHVKDDEVCRSLVEQLITLREKVYMSSSQDIESFLRTLADIRDANICASVVNNVPPLLKKCALEEKIRVIRAFCAIKDDEIRERVADLLPPLLQLASSLLQADAWNDRIPVIKVLAEIDDADNCASVLTLASRLIEEPIMKGKKIVPILATLTEIKDLHVRERVAALAPSLLQKDMKWEDMSAVFLTLAMIKDNEIRERVAASAPRLVSESKDEIDTILLILAGIKDVKFCELVVTFASSLFTEQVSGVSGVARVSVLWRIFCNLEEFGSPELLPFLFTGKMSESDIAFVQSKLPMIQEFCRENKAFFGEWYGGALEWFRSIGFKELR